MSHGPIQMRSPIPDHISLNTETSVFSSSGILHTASTGWKNHTQKDSWKSIAVEKSWVSTNARLMNHQNAWKRSWVATRGSTCFLATATMRENKRAELYGSAAVLRLTRRQKRLRLPQHRLQHLRHPHLQPRRRDAREPFKHLRGWRPLPPIAAISTGLSAKPNRKSFTTFTVEFYMI